MKHLTSQLGFVFVLFIFLYLIAHFPRIFYTVQQLFTFFRLHNTTKYKSLYILHLFVVPQFISFFTAFVLILFRIFFRILFSPLMRFSLRSELLQLSAVAFCGFLRVAATATPPHCAAVHRSLYRIGSCV